MHYGEGGLTLYAAQ